MNCDPPDNCSSINNDTQEHTERKKERKWTVLADYEEQKVQFNERSSSNSGAFICNLLHVWKEEKKTWLTE